MKLSPINGKEGGLEEFLVGVLLADGLLCEAVLYELLHEHSMARKEMLLSESRVVDERSILQMKHVSHVDYC